jgi:tetratricopeptide (TPR) repeat protein
MSSLGISQTQSAFLLKEQGNKSIEKKDWDEAIIYLNKAYYLDSNMKGISWGLSIAYRKKENWDKAIYFATKYISLDKSDKDGWINRAGIYTSKHLFKEALSDINQALIIDPNDKKAKAVKKLLSIVP